MKKIRITWNSPAVLGFAVICLGAFLLNFLTRGRSNQLLFITGHTSLKEPLTYVRFITHVFGHGSWEHLIGNMSYILLLGPMLEEKHGPKKIMEIILVTAVVTGLVNYMFFPGTALCGASGVVFAFIILASFTNFREGEIPITFLLVAAIYLGQQIYEGIAVDDNVSNMAHIIGGIVGGIIGFTMHRKGGPRPPHGPGGDFGHRNHRRR